jgi:hypothetical protein
MPRRRSGKLRWLSIAYFMKHNEVFDNRSTSTSALYRNSEHRLQERSPRSDTEPQELTVATREIQTVPASHPPDR